MGPHQVPCSWHSESGSWLRAVCYSGGTCLSADKRCGGPANGEIDASSLPAKCREGRPCYMRGRVMRMTRANIPSHNRFKAQCGSPAGESSHTRNWGFPALAKGSGSSSSALLEWLRPFDVSGICRAGSKPCIPEVPEHTA